MPSVEPAMKPTEAAAKPSLKERFAVLLKEYGPVAVLVYLTLFLVGVVGFSVAIQAGWSEALSRRFGLTLDGGGGLAGTLVAAWALTKVLQVPRILATVVLTPLVGNIPLVIRLRERLDKSKRGAA
ncbi:MAG: hypothetical protein HY901_12265 [Deltaproteobacteria bacterium]|nr:hypothetical protein [Deltaproteobacteria bacterium]